jgi:hypothetical protein
MVVGANPVLKLVASGAGLIGLPARELLYHRFAGWYFAALNAKEAPTMATTARTVREILILFIRIVAFSKKAKICDDESLTLFWRFSASPRLLAFRTT